MQSTVQINVERWTRDGQRVVSKHVVRNLKGQFLGVTNTTKETLLFTLSE